MHDRDDLRAARLVSELSAAWTITASIVAVIVGASAGSMVLVAFGAVGLVDAAGSIALAHHFRHGLRVDQLEDRFEQRAHSVVTFGLLTVGAATIVVSAIRLATGAHPGSSVVAVAVAAVSLVALTALSARKRVLARRVGSAALRADAHLSAVGAMHAAVALAGVATSEWLEWHSADALAALVVGAAACGFGAQSWRARA